MNVIKMKSSVFSFCLVAAMLSTCFRASGAFVLTFPSTTRRHSSISASSSDEVERLKESALKLREEAEALRKNLDDSPRKKKSSLSNAPAPQPLAYTDLKDSTWTLTYRCSNEPINDDNDKNVKEEEPPRINYSGKLTVTFRSDGYTDLVKHEPSTASPSLDITKVWGWDEETSNEDEERYVLFSVNTKSDDRYYWQARMDVNERDEISLADGTVTVKKDVKPPGGFWGVFNGGGILAQFRYVGNFGGKPVRV